MKKIRNLLFAGLVVIGFAACNNEEIPNGGEEGGKYDTYLTLNIKTPPAPSTPKTVGPDAPDKDGSTIASVQVYLVRNGQIEFSATPDITGLETASFEAPTGNYKVFVVANPNGKTPLRTTGNISAVIDEVTKAQAENGYDGGKNFMMATAAIDDDGNNITDILQMGADVPINSTHTEDNPATATVLVDRAAVKIKSETKPGDVTGLLADNSDITKITKITAEGSATPFITKLNLVGFALINGNESFNLFQKIEALSGNIKGTVANTPQGTEEDIDPNDSNKGKVMKGYYSPITDFGRVSKTMNPDGTWITETIEDLSKADDYGAGPVFTVENRPDFVEKTALTASQARSTGVLYRMVVNPDTDGKGETFYYVGGKVYTTLADLMTLDAFKDKQWDADTPASDIRVAGVKVYENGVMYYTEYIKDQNYQVQYGTVNTKYYNVLRNSVYNLTINSISNIGDDIPGGGEVTPDNPDPEIDPDKTYLQVTVKINPWVLNNIEVDL